MSRENVEVVRRVYDAVARRDREAVLALYDPDVEWDGSRSRWSEVMAGDSRWRGHEGLKRFFRHYYEMWENLEDDVQELIDAGDHVISVVTIRGRGRASGLPVEWKGNTGVWTIRGGKVTRVVWFPTREEALEAVGLPESPRSRANADAVRAAYDEWGKGNLRAGVDLYDPDVVFISGPDWADSARYIGPDGIAKFMREYLAAWTDLTYAAEEVIEVDNSVVVAVRQQGVGRESGAATEWRGFHVWTFRGPTVIRLEAFSDRTTALEAVGLRE